MAPRKVKGAVASSTDVNAGASATAPKIQGKGKTKTARWKKIGGLRDMLGMPVDIIQEITRYLHPKDLLSLSWSSKALHQFFTNKGSEYMWKQSYRNLPWELPFPEGIIEPALAILLFTAFCTGCGTCTTDEDPIWEFNARFCEDCIKTKLVRSIDPLGEVLRDKTHLRAHIPLAVFTPSRQFSGNGNRMYLRIDMEEVIDNWDRLLKLGDEDALAMFIGRRILRVQRAPVHGVRCKAWADRQAQFLIDERKAIENEYLHGIISRLRELGWGVELDHLQACNYADIREHQLFNPNQKLTDRLWRVIGNDMDECMKRAQDYRLTREYVEKMQLRWLPLLATVNRLLQRPEAREYGLSIGDIALMPEIREVAGAPDGVQVDEASFAEVHEKFGEMIERWKLNAVDQLREIVLQSRSGLKAMRNSKAAGSKVDVFELATIRFHCSKCDDRSMALYYPGVLAHACLRDERVPTKEDDLYKRCVYHRLIRGREGMLCGFDKLTVAEPSEAAKKVIRLCGKDPKVATVEEMNALDVMLVHKGEIRTWRNAILFDDIHRTVSKWRLATPDEIAAVKTYLPELRKQRSRYHCVPCQEALWGGISGAIKHLDYRHGIESSSVDHEFLKSDLPPDGLFAAGAFKMTLGSKA